MNYSLRKFEEYLNYYLGHLELEKVKYRTKFFNKEITDSSFKKKNNTTNSKITVVKNMLFSIRDEMHVELFDDFQVMCHFLMEERFTPKDCVNIIMHIIRNNSHRPQEIDAVFDLSAIQSYKFNSMTSDEVRLLINTRRFSDLVELRRTDYTPKEEKFIEEFYQNIDSFSIDCSVFLRKNRIVLRHFDDMKGVADLKFIKKGLKSLSVSDDVLDKIMPYLEILAKKAETKLSISNAKSESKKEEKKDEFNETTIKYLTEKDVRDLKKYIRDFFDLYKIKIIKLPNFAELINCIQKLETLEIDHFEIRKFLEMNLDEINNKKNDNYIVNYEELILLTHYLLKYKVGNNKIDLLIKKYKHLKAHEENPIAEVVSHFNEYRFYDEKTADDIKSLLSEMMIINIEDYRIIRELLKEYIKEYEKYEDNIEHIYDEAKNLDESVIKKSR